MQYRLGKRVFMSYRGVDHKLALQGGNWLVQQQYCKEVKYYEPNSLTAQGEVLPIYKYFELVETISDHMALCEGFVYIETDTYWNSFFTQMEQMYWSYFMTQRLKEKEHPKAYRFLKEDDSLFFDEEPVQLERMSRGEISLWTLISRYANKRKRDQMRAPVRAPGKYAEQFHLICCAACGEYILISNKIVDIALKEHKKLPCPHKKLHRGSKEIGFKQGPYRGALPLRLADVLGVIPTIQNQDGTAPARRLSIDEALNLLATEDPPPTTISAYILESEKLCAHFAKIGSVVDKITWSGYKDIILFSNWKH